MILIGDTHGIKPVFEIIDKNSLTGENLIHVGDLGLGFLPINQDLENLLLLDLMLNLSGNHLYAIRGNHDNPIFWDKSLGLNLPKYTNLHLVEDYSVINIEGKNILFVGGAISIDRSVRAQDKPYSSWWPGEKFNLNLDKISKVNRTYSNIDIVVTHNCPDFCYPKFKEINLVKKWINTEKLNPISPFMDLKRELVEERQSFTELDNELQFGNKKVSHWFYGHYHQSHTEKIGDTQFTLLGINEVKELK